MNEYIIALIGTLFIYSLVRIFKSVQRFNLLKQIKARILVLTTIYLMEHLDESFVKYRYRNYVYGKLEEEKMKKWVDAVDIKWISDTKLVVSFEMVYNNNVRMKFDYPMDMEELQIKKAIKRSE